METLQTVSTGKQWYHGPALTSSTVKCSGLTSCGNEVSSCITAEGKSAPCVSMSVCVCVSMSVCV